jgi:dTDP-4-dehydrorhamnose reductase
MVVGTLGDEKNPPPNPVENRCRSLKLLVTGASGLFGSRLAELALRKNLEVYAVSSQHQSPYGTPIQLDVSDKNAVEQTFKKIRPDTVVHAAALTDVDKCEKEKELAWKINVEGTENIVNSSKKNRTFLIYISTDYIFDGEKGLYKENDPPNPINHYGFTKLKAEQHVKRLKEYCIARPSVIYGTTPAAGKVNFALWLINKLKRKEEVKITTDQWNSPTLNTNLAEMTLEIIERKITGVHHLSGATRISRYDFSKLLAQIFNLDGSLIIPSTSPEFHWTAKRPKDSSLNIEKTKQILKTKPLTIDQALEKMKKETQ